MPPLLKFTFFTSTLHPKPLNSLLLRCAAVSFSPPAYSPRRNHSISQPHRSNPSLLGFQIQSQPQLQLRLQSSLIYTYKRGKRGEGGVSVARFSRRGVGGRGGGGGSGLFGDMGSETDNSDDNLLNSALLKHSNHDDELSHSPSKQPRHQSNKFLTLPTILTIGRVAAVPLLICTFYMNTWWGTTATTSIFIAAAITDWLDGYLARKMKLGSAFGAFLDPVADKLMVAATLVLLCTKPPEVALLEQSPWLLTIPSIAIIGREITMSAVREWAASQSGNLSEAVAVNNLGKWKTATQMIAITILLATRDSSLAGPGVLVASGVTLLYISAWLALWSLVVYMKKIWKVLLK